MHNQKKYEAARAGFTLIELLVVIAIIGLLSGVVLASMNSMRQRAQTTAGLQMEASTNRSVGDSEVAGMNFDEGAGTTTMDSGSGIATTIPATSMWTTDTPSGKGAALSFDGSSQYLSVSTLPDTGTSGTATIMAWIKPSGTGYYAVLSKGQSGSCFNYGIIVSAGVLRGRNTNMDWPVASNVIQTNVWQHVALVYNPTGIYGYVNGKYVGSDTTHFTTGCSVATLSIGLTPTRSDYFLGKIDNVHVYSRALEVAEIQKMYASEIPMHVAPGNTSVAALAVSAVRASSRFLFLYPSIGSAHQ